MAEDIIIPRDSWPITNISSEVIRISDIPNLPAISPGQTIDGLDFVSRAAISTSVIYRNFINDRKIRSSGYLHTHDDKSDVGHTHDDKSDVGHTHDDKSDVGHTHEGLDTLTDGGNADNLHTHSGFATEQEVNTLITDVAGDSIDKAHDEDHTLLSHINGQLPFTIVNFKKLFDGSNADSLHTHSSGVTFAHNNLTSIQGGTTSQYYHLTSSEHSELTTWLDDVTLNDGGGVSSIKLSSLVTNGFVKTSGGDGTLSVDTNSYLTTISGEDHNTLGGLQGGGIDEYYHLTSSESELVGRLGEDSSGPTFDDVSLLDSLWVRNDDVLRPIGNEDVEFRADTYWTGSGSGLPYGAMYQEETGFAVTLTNQNQWYELDAVTTNISAGQLNLVTFPGDHYLQVAKAGRYKIKYALTGQIGTANQGIGFGIMVNDIIQSPGKSRMFFLNATRNLNISGITILNLAENNQISLGARNVTSANRVLTVSFINVVITMVGG